MRAIMQWERRSAGTVCTLHAITLPGLYHRDYHFRAVHVVDSPTATLYCFATKANAKNKALILPGPALGSGLITLGQSNQVVAITPTGGAAPDITGMQVTVTSTATTTIAWSEGWSVTANFGYHVTDEMLLWLSDDADQASAGMPFEDWSFTLAPEGLIPARFPHVVGSFLDLDPVFAESKRFMLLATVLFRVYVVGETRSAFDTCCETLAQVRSLLLDDYRKTPVLPWGRIYHDIHSAGAERPDRISQDDFRGFGGAVRFRVEIEAASHSG